ncbi:MAG: pyruvate kinase [Candidatus Puniceispirillaceae bacterium]
MTQTGHSTKILATLGDHTGTAEMVTKLVQAGVNMLRLNFSHGTQDDHAKRIKAIREVEEQLGQPIGILADLQGPKYRIGVMEDDVIITEGEEVTFTLDDVVGTKTRICLPHADIMKAMMPKTTIVMDDGKLRLTVASVSDAQFTAKVVTGGPVKSRKGVNVPDVVLDTKPLTDKDLSDLSFALDQGVDGVALSFVQRASDVIEAKALIKDRAFLISKIEKPAALDDIDDIIAASDAIMIARGDLGVELPSEVVPSVQKRLIRKCRLVGKPVVVATQMLESMITAPTPTRAEASDVATAVFDGADTVMLSAETAAGAYPVEAVSIMSRIITTTEAHIASHPDDGPSQLQVEPSIYHAVAQSAVKLADDIQAAALVVFTASGNTAVRVARERPAMPFVVMTPDPKVQRRLTMLWGAKTAAQAETDYESAIQLASDHVRTTGMGRMGEQIVVVAGMPFGKAGTTNSMRVVEL